MADHVEELSLFIAQTPLERRDASRLLTLDKTTGAVAHHHFYELPQFLRPNDCLVLNDSRVLPARLLGHRSTGGAVEVLEGDWNPGRTVLLKFPSFEAARAFYDTPEYQKAKAAREGAAVMRMVCVEGV